VSVPHALGSSSAYGFTATLWKAAGLNRFEREFILGVELRRGGQLAAPQFDIDCDGADRDHDLCEGHGGRATVW